ncbi:MAG: hypothetical protein OXD50_01160 [Chloroflexi bacterium]|nr:hypothetical protein [Chloroflexota bacterium]
MPEQDIDAALDAAQQWYDSLLFALLQVGGIDPTSSDVASQIRESVHRDLFPLPPLVARGISARYDYTATAARLLEERGYRDPYGLLGGLLDLKALAAEDEEK